MTTQQINHTSPRIAIIGAGLTGLITATLLERAFADAAIKPKIDIFEKSAGVGRLATRYKMLQPNVGSKSNPPDDRSKLQYQFDFGVPFFTAKSKPFQDFIQPWVQCGVLQPWYANVVYFENDASSNRLRFIDRASIQQHWDANKPRYISVPKMTSWGRALANSLSMTLIHFKTRVAPLSKRSFDEDTNLTTLYDDKGNSLGEFDWVICTAPSEQAIELFVQTSFSYLTDIKTVNMQACYSLMLGWQRADTMPKVLQDAKWDVAQLKSATKNAILDKLFIEHHKPAREHLLPCITVHASNEWSQAHVDEDIESVIKALTNATCQLLNWHDNQRPDYIDCHRWRYAATKSHTNGNTRADAFIDASRNWIVAGDWCVAGRVESCFESALTVVNRACGTFDHGTGGDYFLGNMQ